MSGSAAYKCYLISFLQQTQEVIHDIDAYLQIKKLRHRELKKLCKVTELVRAELGFERRLSKCRAPALN